MLCWAAATLSACRDLRLHVDGQGDEPFTRRGDVTGLGHRCYSRQPHPTLSYAKHACMSSHAVVYAVKTSCRHDVSLQARPRKSEMVVESHKAKRGLAITAGITAIAAGAALNVTHLVEGGQPLYSPMTGAILALALGAVAAALVASEAWRSGRKDLGIMPYPIDCGRRGVWLDHGSRAAALRTRGPPARGGSDQHGALDRYGAL